MQEKVSMQPFAVRNGLVLGLISSVFTLVMSITDWQLDPSVSWIAWPIGLGLTIFFMIKTFNAFKSENEGYMSLGEGFKGGFIMTMISTFITNTVNYVYMAFVDPSIISRMLDIQREALMQSSDLTEEQVEQSLSMMSNFMTPEVIVITAVIIGIIVGAIISLIIAAIAKKDYETY